MTSAKSGDQYSGVDDILSFNRAGRSPVPKPVHHEADARFWQENVGNSDWPTGGDGTNGAPTQCLGAVKAIAAPSLALHPYGYQRMSLDSVVATMGQTGADMQSKYKVTSLGIGGEFRRVPKSLLT
jgi:hypothetical protein